MSELSFCPRCNAGVWYGIEHRCLPITVSSGTNLTITTGDDRLDRDPENVKETQYGVRMCDGEVPQIWSNHEDAVKELKVIRMCIASGKFDADDYEPMTIVRRTRSVLVSSWIPA